jgi:hypothetical protein
MSISSCSFPWFHSEQSSASTINDTYLSAARNTVVGEDRVGRRRAGEGTFGARAGDRGVEGQVDGERLREAVRVVVGDVADLEAWALVLGLGGSERIQDTGTKFLYECLLLRPGGFRTRSISCHPRASSWRRTGGSRIPLTLRVPVSVGGCREVAAGF